MRSKTSTRKPSKKLSNQTKPTKQATTELPPWLAPAPVTRRHTLIATVLKVLDAWERYRRSGNADDGDDALRSFVESMLTSIDWAAVKPSSLRLAFSAICECLPTRDLVLFRSKAEHELNLLAECIADLDMDPQGRDVVRAIQALRGPRPKAYAAAVAFIEALQEPPAYVHPVKAEPEKP